MLPKSDPPLLESTRLLRKSDYSIQNLVSTHRRTWILLSIISLQTFLLFIIYSLPVSFSFHHFPPSNHFSLIKFKNHRVNFIKEEEEERGKLCELGKVYVYNLPDKFNKELAEKCDELNPWRSRCEAISNNGFGPKVDTLTGVIPENLTHSWYWTDQFVSEIIFHNRILGLKCRTLDPESASAFYIPFYGGLAVGKYLWSGKYNSSHRDYHSKMVLDWVKDQVYWKRSNGWDHFMMLGRISWDFRRSKDGDWGSSLIYMPEMKNITRLLIERNPWDYFDIGVPYPTGFHPRTDSDIIEWQNFVRDRNRSSLFSFVGGTRGKIKNDFRSILLDQCKTESNSCRVVDCSLNRCSNGSSAILETFLSSEFCLQPRGDSFTRRSIFDCMIAGSVPVFFWHRTAYYQYEWFLPGEPKSYSVFIDRKDVVNGTSIREVLEKLSKEEVRKMREKVIDYIPKLVYAEPRGGLETINDAFDVAIDGVLKRFRRHKMMKSRGNIRKVKGE